MKWDKLEDSGQPSNGSCRKITQRVANARHISESFNERATADGVGGVRVTRASINVLSTVTVSTTLHVCSIIFGYSGRLLYVNYDIHVQSFVTL